MASFVQQHPSHRVLSDMQNLHLVLTDTYIFQDLDLNQMSVAPIMNGSTHVPQQVHAHDIPQTH